MHTFIVFDSDFHSKPVPNFYNAVKGPWMVLATASSSTYKYSLSNLGVVSLRAAPEIQPQGSYSQRPALIIV